MSGHARTVVLLNSITAVVACKRLRESAPTSELINEERKKTWIEGVWG